MLPEESSGARHHRREISEVVRQLGRQKISRWLAVAAIVIPVSISGAGFVWGASKIVSMMSSVTEELTSVKDEISHEIEGLTREVSGLRAEIGEIRGAQGAQALLVVELTKDVEHLQKDLADAEVLLVDQMNKMTYRTAEGKAFRARFEMMGFPVPPLDKGDGP